MNPKVKHAIKEMRPLKTYLDATENYLQGKLIPFWAGRIEERRYGGFQPSCDRQGRRKATDKAMLAQARAIFTIAHALRMGFDWPDGRGQLQRGIDFLLRHFLDPEYDGYCWMTAADGRVLNHVKVIYGHSFLIYSLAEHALLTGDPRSRAEACRVFGLLMERAADIRYGGFFEHFDRTWKLETVRSDGAPHKSLDVHMHLLEAFTALYELTGTFRHRQALEQVTELVFERMTDPATGLGIAMFKPDWTPINNLQLGALWGRDRFEPAGKPPEITSYGHNIELAWLYLHSLDVLGRPREQGRARVLPIFEHTWRDGVDRECGGLFVEGHRAHGPMEKNKEFWQQAEALIGFLDAHRMTGEERYLEAFRNLHDFVFAKMICWEHGEWFPLLSREGAVLRDDLGYHWKIGYHTVRSMCEVVSRLRAML